MQLGVNRASKYIEIRSCRVCGNANLTPILNLGVQALTGVFPKHLSEAVPQAPLELIKCTPRAHETVCGLVQLRHSCDPTAMYGANYGYRSGLNDSMVAHLRSKAQRIKSEIDLRAGDLVLDIGSNDSTFLQALWEPGLTAVGIDPTGRKFESYYPSHIQLVPDFFSRDIFQKKFPDRKARVITSFSMFYDLERPFDFLEEVEAVLDDDGVWVFEQSYLPLMIERNSYDTICHEHLEYYALGQILFMVERAGLRIIDVEVNDVNGGSFSLVVAKQKSRYSVNALAIDELLRTEAELGLDGIAIFEKFCERVTAHRDQVRQFLQEAANRKEKILGYGASTKGNVLLQYCNIGPKDLPYIADVNPDKFGSYTPGTQIPIISEQEARRHDPDAFLVLPWHFRDHILRREADFLSSGHKLVFPLPEFEVISDVVNSHHK